MKLFEMVLVQSLKCLTQDYERNVDRSNLLPPINFNSRNREGRIKTQSPYAMLKYELLMSPQYMVSHSSHYPTPTIDLSLPHRAGIIK